MKKLTIFVFLCSLSSLSAMDHEDDYGNYGLEACPPPGHSVDDLLTYGSFASTPLEYRRNLDEKELAYRLFGDVTSNLNKHLATAIINNAPTENITRLIQQGANPTSGLFSAIDSPRSTEYVPLLLDFGANPNAFDPINGVFILEKSILKTPLLSKLLLHHGAKPTWRAWVIGLSLHCQAIIPLIWYGIHPDTVLDSQNTTALIKLSAKHNVHNLPELIESLLFFGANPNHVNKQCKSPLIINTIAGDPQHQVAVIKHLLAYGANPHTKDSFNQSALNYIQSYARSPELKLLIQEGIKAYQCLICMEHENKELKFLPCTNKHLGNFICPDCLAHVKTKNNSCPLCRNRLS